MRRYVLWTAVFALLCSGHAGAQGVQTGTISGEVISSDGQPLPGAVITVQSPSLQGVKTATSDTKGNYILKALPPGEYTVTFTFSGMKTIEKKVVVDLGRSINVDATLPLATVEEVVTVTAEPASILQQSTVGQNFRAAEVDKLATGRTLFAIAELSPGLSDRSPNGNLTLSGSFAWDNVFLINGVDVNDNLFGSPTSLFIEDAIEEVQVLTTGISAEYGRFGGGVVNAITKRGGNVYAGSFRVDFTNPAWRDENPIEDRNGTKRQSVTNKDYQATLGGPLVRDRLWFFGAGRLQDRTSSSTLLVTRIPYTSTLENDRAELKLTGTVARDHTLQASFINNKTVEEGPSLASYAGDTDVFYDPPRTLPSHLFVTNYNGVLRPNLFVDAQYSEKTFRFENTGGNKTSIVDSPIFTLTSAYSPQHYWNAPYFDNTDPEDRDNRQIAASLSYFLSTANMGRHDVKVGYENFRSTRTGGNSQTATGWVLYADYLGGPGTPTRDANGKMQPIFETGENYAARWFPTRGARLDVTTQSFYLNDRWQISSRFSANVGFRYERVRAEATGDIVSADTDTFVPRLGLSFDPQGNGKWRLDATYSQYSGKFSENQFGENTAVGNPSFAYYLYTGPNGVGMNFAPGFDPANYTTFLGGQVPIANVFVEDGLRSPTTREFSFSVGRSLPDGGYVRASYSNRKVSNFIDDFKDTTTGDTVLTLQGNTLGTVDNVIYRNTDTPRREYQALQVQAAYRVLSRLRVEAAWTHQFRNHGTYEGEGTNTPGSVSLFGDYPEVFNESRHFPFGRLDDYQRDKVRAWTTYDFGFGRFGAVNLGLLYRFNSPLTVSRVATNQPFSSVQEAGRRLYVAPPARSSHSVFFGPRGAEEFSSEHNVDVALNYDVPVYRKLRPYVKLEVRNALNDQAQIGGSGSVRPDPNSPLDQFGLRTGFLPNTNFRVASASSSYQLPREYRFSVGFRF